MPDEGEKQVMDLLRGDNCSSFRLTIKRIEKFWDVELSVPPHDPSHVGRGVGSTFAQAWHGVERICEASERRVSSPPTAPINNLTGSGARSTKLPEILAEQTDDEPDVAAT